MGRTRPALMRGTALSLVGVFALASCNFAAHPAASAAVVGGTLGFTTCELGTDGMHGTCATVGGGAAALLGGAVMFALLLGGEGDTVLNPPEDAVAPRPEPPSIDEPPRAPLTAPRAPLAAPAPAAAPPSPAPTGAPPSPAPPAPLPPGTAPPPPPR